MSVEADSILAYENAVSIMENASSKNDYLKAANAFHDLNGYNDSETKAFECEQLAKQIDYNKAVKKKSEATDEKSFKDAARMFKELGDYTFELEESVYGNFSKNTHWKIRKYEKENLTAREKSNHLFEHLSLDFNNAEKKLYHIHGDLHSPRAMIMGHYYYGKLLSDIQKHIALFMKNYKAAMTKGNNYKPVSWLDYFMLEDVYVFGLGFDLSEVDLWWLLCCKKRNFPETKVYYYKPSTENNVGRQMMFDVYDVETQNINCKGDYKLFYNKVLKDVMNKMLE